MVLNRNLLVVLILLNGIRLNSQELLTSDKLKEILSGKDAKVDYVLANADKFHFQLILTTYSYDTGKIRLTHADINKDQYYFSPASLIKFPVAIVAAEKLSKLYDIYNITADDSIALSACFCNQSTANYINKTRSSSFRQVLRETMILSNNAGYNLLFDFLGKDTFNFRMRQLGYTHINLRNRFYPSCTEEQQAWFGGIKFYGPDKRLKYELPCQRSQHPWYNDSTWPHLAGKRYAADKRLVNGPKNYIYENYVSLFYAHQLMMQLMESEHSEKNNRLIINQVIKEELVDALGSYPRELQSTNYQNEKIPDTYYKFFLDPKTMQTGAGELRIYNKVGIAGGFISDVSFFHDQVTGLKFFLSGAMMSVENEVIDYRHYKYYDLGIPVFRKIGQLLYEYLLNSLPDDTN